ncbi:hypothetical protein I3843_04G140000 [Carya illinoinensis]|nr:hypothetical protein I3843_04G140000 [Carya illinoinensis]
MENLVVARCLSSSLQPPTVCTDAQLCPSIYGTK